MTDLLTTSEAAHLLGCSQWTVVRWAKSGKLDAATQLTSGGWLFTRRAVDECLARLADDEDGAA